MCVRRGLDFPMAQSTTRSKITNASDDAARARDAAHRAAWLKKQEERQQAAPAEQESSEVVDAALIKTLEPSETLDTALRETLESRETLDAASKETLESSEADIAEMNFLVNFVNTEVKPMVG